MESKKAKRVVKRPGTKRKAAASADRSGRPKAVGGKAPVTRKASVRKVARHFPKLARATGWGVTLAVAERTEGGWDVADSTKEIVVSNGFQKAARKGDSQARSPKTGRTRRGFKAADIQRTCEAFAAMGHPQRVVLLGKLLEGPATYAALQRVTKLKAGPLYHHINQLRLAGLILPKQRDLYELTRGGRNLMLTAMAAGPLLKDKRRRP